MLSNYGAELQFVAAADRGPRCRIPGLPRLEQRLRSSITGDVLFDPFNRGRYATDASFYQIMPAGVVLPRTMDEALRALAICRDDGRIVTPRGGGTSQCGQTVNDGIVIDFSKHLNRIVSLDVENRSCVVEPGIVLDDLNRQLRKHGLWFPVDVSTASRATIGGMAGNNSCGGRSLRYGTMRDNTLSMDAALADGTLLHFGEVPRDLAQVNSSDSGQHLFRDLLDLGEREATEIAEKFPKVQRRVGGYNLDALVPRNAPNNMAHLLVGSEGTLAFTTQVELKLWPLIRNKVLGVCHFGSFYEAMDAAQHLVKLRPIAVELVDRTMLALGREIAMFQPIIGVAVRGDPDAVLIVEFAEEDQAENIRRLKQLGELMADLGFGWDHPQTQMGRRGRDHRTELADRHRRVSRRGSQCHDVDEAGGQAGLVRRGLRGAAAASCRLYRAAQRHFCQARHPRHHVCARLGRLSACQAGAQPETRKGRQGDARHRRRNLRDGARIQGFAFRRARRRHRAIGIPRDDVRPAHHRRLQGGQAPLRSRTMCSIPARSSMRPEWTTARCFAIRPDYRVGELKTALDWSAYPGAGGGFQGAVEMCNNNGACRKLEGGVMCPSYRATRDEKDVTRGRANTLRLAISGQLGPDALASDEMADTLKLCVSCKACRHECPTGVDMAKMKIEVLAARAARHGLSLRDRLVGYLPRYAGTGVALRPARQLAQQQHAVAKAVRTSCRHQRAACVAGVAARCVQVRSRDAGSGRRPRSRAVRRYVQPRL